MHAPDEGPAPVTSGQGQLLMCLVLVVLLLPWLSTCCHQCHGQRWKGNCLLVQMTLLLLLLLLHPLQPAPPVAPDEGPPPVR
jgi:hypothetical protein